MNNKCITIEELELPKDYFIREVNGHSIYFRPYTHDFDLSLNTKIYHYMKLSTLLDMLFYKRMHVSNREKFTDLREKKGLNKIVEELSSFSPVPSYNDMIRLRKAEKDKSRALSVCVSCWTLDRRCNDKIDESFLMWKAYSEDNIVCRIGTTIGQLINSIKTTPSDIIISNVDYKGKIEMNKYEDLIFRKSIFYEDEQEVRMVVLSNSKDGVDIKVDNKTLLNEILISPFIPPVFAYFILSELKVWCKKYNSIQIGYSKVMEYIETNKNFKRTNESYL